MEIITDNIKQQNPLADRTDTQIRLAIRALAADEIILAGLSPTYRENVLEEAANRLQRFERLTTLLGLLAPAGTAPRTALEQLYEQSSANANESPIVLEIRHMLEPHWGEWTPILREADGLPGLET